MTAIDRRRRNVTWCVNDEKGDLYSATRSTRCIASTGASRSREDAVAADLLAGAEPDVTLDDEIRCVEREIAMRVQVYRRRILRGQMTGGEADREIRTMQAVLARLRVAKRAARP